MKTNKSAPLNLCAPVGVTGTTLPASEVHTVKCVSYFYPTSDNAKRFNLPNGGYDVNVTTFAGEHSKLTRSHLKTVAAFATKAEAMEHAAVLPHPWASWMAGIDSLSSPVKDTPAFAVGDVVRVISPKDHRGDIRHGDPTVGTVIDIMPDSRRRFVYRCSEIGSWFENQIELVSRASASPVESVGVPESNPYDLGLDLPLVWSPTDSGSVMHAQQAVIMDDNGFKLAECSTEFARAACRGLNGYASHAAKDAKIKALELALKDCVESLSRLPDTEGAYRVTCLESAKAALALPCAPLGS